MNFSDFTSINSVVAESSKECGDEDLSNGFSKGWYRSRISDALTELSYDTFFSTITKDIFDWNKDGTNSVSLPKGVFNVREIYLFNGDCCIVDNAVIVHYKRLFNNSGKGSKYVTQKTNEGLSKDAIYGGYYPMRGFTRQNFSSCKGVAYGNIQNGRVMIVDGFEEYKNMRIVANGVEGDIHEKNVIPSFLKRAIVDYIKVKFFAVKKSKDFSFRALWAEAKGDLYGDRYDEGSWIKAERRVKKMDSWSKESLQEYLSRAHE